MVQAPGILNRRLDFLVGRLDGVHVGDAAQREHPRVLDTGQRCASVEVQLRFLRPVVGGQLAQVAGQQGGDSVVEVGLHELTAVLLDGIFSLVGFAVALITTTALVAILGLESVAVVGDSTSIPRSLPSLNLPDLSLIPAMFTPALVIAIIALVQADGVSQSIPNPDGDFPDSSGDFRGQGVANIAVGFTGGISVGGSVSGTIQVQSIGGKSRWANIFTGVFATLCVLLIAPLIEFIPMATLAGTLIVVGVQMINVPRIETVWHTGWIPATVMIVTLIFTLFTPLQVAVAVGVVLHGIMFIYQSAEAVQIKRVVPQPDGTFIDDDVPEVLPSGEIVALQPIGSLFFAGAAEFEEHLPEVGDAHRSVVIIGLRGRDEIGSTFVRIIERYAKQLDSTGNKLMLVGMNERIIEQLEKTELMDLLGKEDIFPAESQYFGPLKKALAAANAWIDTE